MTPFNDLSMKAGAAKKKTPAATAAKVANAATAMRAPRLMCLRPDSQVESNA